MPVADLRDPETDPAADQSDPAMAVNGDSASRRSIWPSIYPRVLEMVREHSSTIVFVNNRRLAERLALRLNDLAEEEIARSHHGSLSREARTEIEEELKSGRLQVPGRDQLARARHRHGRRRPRRADRVAEVGRARAAARRPRRPHALAGLEGAAVPEVPRRPGRVRRGHEADARARDRGDRRSRARRSTCWPSRWSRWSRSRTGRSTTCTASSRPRTRTATCRRRSSRTCSTCSTGAIPSEEFAELRPRLVWDRIEGTLRARRGSQKLAVTNAGTIPDRGLYGVHLPGRPARRRARRGDGLRGAGRARPSGSARRPGGSRTSPATG